MVLVGILLSSSAVTIAKSHNEIAPRMKKFLQGEKTKIKKEELPEPVRKKLNGDAFKGWAVENAYKLSSGEFEVELKKGDTTQALKFDKDGNVK